MAAACPIPPRAALAAGRVAAKADGRARGMRRISFRAFVAGAAAIPAFPQKHPRASAGGEAPVPGAPPSKS